MFLIRSQGTTHRATLPWPFKHEEADYGLCTAFGQSHVHYPHYPPAPTAVVIRRVIPQGVRHLPLIDYPPPSLPAGSPMPHPRTHPTPNPAACSAFTG